MAGYGSASPTWDDPPRARVAQLVSFWYCFASYWLVGGYWMERSFDVRNNFVRVVNCLWIVFLQAGFLSILLATLVVTSNAGESVHPQALRPWFGSPFHWGKNEMSLSEKVQALRAANERRSRVTQELAFGNPLVYGGAVHHRSAQDAATAAAAVAAAAAAHVKKTDAENAANAAESEHEPGFVIASTDDSPPVSKSAISHTMKLFEGPPEKSDSTAQQGASMVEKLKEENEKLEEESVKITHESATLGRAKGTAPIKFEHVNKPPLVKASKLDEAKKLIEQIDTHFPVHIHDLQDSHDKHRTEDALRGQHLAKEHAQELAPAEEAKPEQAEVKKDETNIGSPFGLLKRGWEVTASIFIVCTLRCVQIKGHQNSSDFLVKPCQIRSADW